MQGWLKAFESNGLIERDDDGTVIAARTVNADGRSRAHLGGRSVPAGVLAEFTDPLLTVHGQNDQLRLLRGDQQRSALARFGGSACVIRSASTAATSADAIATASANAGYPARVAG